MTYPVVETVQRDHVCHVVRAPAPVAPEIAGRAADLARRAVLGWPLGSPALRVPAAVMINLLANANGPGTPQGLAEALRVCGAHVHLYGKARSAEGRKMGHVTALGQTVEAALASAQRAAHAIQFGDAT